MVPTVTNRKLVFLVRRFWLFLGDVSHLSQADTPLSSGLCSAGVCAQSPGQVGDPCLDHADCGVTRQLPDFPAQQIYCGSENICGGKLAKCMFFVSGFGGYNDACLSRTSDPSSSQPLSNMFAPDNPAQD
jgi:hypothetical protein